MDADLFKIAVYSRQKVTYYINKLEFTHANKNNSEAEYLRIAVAANTTANTGHRTKLNGTEIQNLLCPFHRTTIKMTEEQKYKTFLPNSPCLSVYLPLACQN
jgi:hypothetical protein